MNLRPLRDGRFAPYQFDGFETALRSLPPQQVVPTQEATPSLRRVLRSALASASM